MREIELISNYAMHRVSEIKLIRTDTTLDLSQKAEKVCFSSRIVEPEGITKKYLVGKRLRAGIWGHTPMPPLAGDRGVGGPKPAA